MTDQKKVIVLILSYNGKLLLDEAISSYFSNPYANFKVVVIDNGSTDGTKEYVANKWPEVKILRTEKNLGYSGGFNFGLDYAFNHCKADYALITNNDVKADSQVIQSLVETAERDKTIGFVTGKVFYYDNPNILQTTGFELTDSTYWLFSHRGAKEKDNGQFEKIEELEFADDIFMLVRNEVFQDTYGYDTNFQFQAEQFDWQIRTKNKGYKIFYTPFARIWHKDSFTIGKLSPFKTYYNIRNTYILRMKYFNKEFIQRFSRWYLKNHFFKPFLRSMIKFQFNYAYMILKGYISAILWGLRNDKFYI